jgi:hypothetical protein
MRDLTRVCGMEVEEGVQQGDDAVSGGRRWGGGEFEEVRVLDCAL